MQSNDDMSHDGYALRYLSALGFLGFLGLEALGWPVGRELAKLALISLAAFDSFVPRRGSKIKPIPREARSNLVWLLFLGFLFFIWTSAPILALLSSLATMAFLANRGDNVRSAVNPRRS